MIRNELQRYNMDNAKQKSTHYSTIFLLLYYPFHAIAHPSHLFYFQGITLSSCKRYAFAPQKGCYYALKAVRLHSKSNAIAKHGEWNWIKERFLQDFKDEQKETKAEWIKGRKDT